MRSAEEWQNSLLNAWQIGPVYTLRKRTEPGDEDT